MSIGLFPVFNPDGATSWYSAEGSALAKEFGRLDRLAQANGLCPLSAFGDGRESTFGFGGTTDELEAVLGPCNAWYSVNEGLRAVESLIAIIHDGLPELDEPDEVAFELQELARCLRAAESRARGVLFRLEIA